MVPTKAKVRMTRGVATSTPQTEETKGAGNKRLATTVWGQNKIDAKEVSVTVQQDVTQKLDALVKAMMDISRQVEAIEYHQREGGGASPYNSPSTSHPRWRAI